MIKELFEKLNQKWYNSIIILIIGIIITYLCIQLPLEIATNNSLLIFYFSVIITLCFGIFRFIKKDYLYGILQILITTIIGFVAFAFFLIIYLFNPNDYFADNLEVPQNIEFEKPSRKNTNVKSIKITNSTLLLYDGFQPGMYTYDLYLNKIEKGIVYLKVYEITQNTILSEDDIKEQSKLRVYNPTDEIRKFSLKDDFTVYEGNWDQLYGSRIEVWFQPDKNVEQEKKIFSTNYIIQGWER